MKHELLVPVGNYECLIAAINSGADAVYLGGKKFGARAFASNFSLEDLDKAVKLCHLYNVKIYVTVNTLIFDFEINEVLEYVKSLAKIGVDALIMQDVGLINLVHKTLPNLEIHASTQMHNHSSESLNFLKNLGVKRIVFARELSLDYINAIETDLEKEVFIHGSLCVSYSGQCLFSSRILNRSGNRGECAGICRLPYSLYENDTKVITNGEYLLSPKDLCSLDNFKTLMDSNVKCFKIEGRMKSAAYVGIVTKIYKDLMNKYENNEELVVNQDDYLKLVSIFNREYTKGYLFNDNNIMNFKAPNHQGLIIGNIIEVTPKKIGIKLLYNLHQFEGIRFIKSNQGMTINFLYDKDDNLINFAKKGETVYLDNIFHLKEKEQIALTNPLINVDNNITKKIGINVKLILKVGKPMKIIVNDFFNNIELTSDIVDASINAPLTKNRIIKILNKTHDTPFIINNLNIEMDDNIFIPIGKLNELRRNALSELQSLRENQKKEYIEINYQEKDVNQEKTRDIMVLVRTKEQLKACCDMHIKNIVVTDKVLMKDNYIFRCFRDNLKHNYSYPNLLVTDYASLDKYRNSMGDYFLNITNHYTLNYLANYAKKLCLSIECSDDDIFDIVSNSKVNIEVYLYGRVELMQMKYCPLKTIINKDKICTVCQNNKIYKLKDRNNKFYQIVTNKNHGTTILDTILINNISKLKKYKEHNINNFRVEFSDESYDECLDILKKVTN